MSSSSYFNYFIFEGITGNMSGGSFTHCIGFFCLAFRNYPKIFFADLLNVSVSSSFKINETRFGNGSELSGDQFGNAVAGLGDLDGDGVEDMVVGEYTNDDGGT